MQEHRSDMAADRPSVGVRPRSLDATSIAVLKEALANKDYAVRLVALEALGQTKLDALVPWLEHALGDPEHDVRMTAAEALVKIRSPRALALLATVRDDREESLDIRALAAAALLEVP
jgi:HEAT repeat protein